MEHLYILIGFIIAWFRQDIWDLFIDVYELLKKK